MDAINGSSGLYTLPHAFKTITFAIIDGSEVFIQTPSDLQFQSSTWSSYKHAKFLLACTPNGAVSYISPLFVGSISDVELTRVCGFLDKLAGKQGISIMADRGFTIKDQLGIIEYSPIYGWSSAITIIRSSAWLIDSFTQNTR